MMGLAHCTQREDAGQAAGVRYGEAVAIRVEGAHLPPYQLVVAANEGSKVDALVQPLTALVHPALLACPPPSSASEAAAASITLSLAVREGRLRGAPAVQGQATTRTACVLQHLEGSVLADAGPLPSDLLVQLRFGPEAR
jgi:hypothetical protein